ncbi:small, acid-soluble spore protein, alpha/beta type [Bacillus thuringiensis]
MIHHHLQMVRIGGEITKRLVRMVEKQLTGQYGLFFL